VEKVVDKVSLLLSFHSSKPVHHFLHLGFNNLRLVWRVYWCIQTLEKFGDFLYFLTLFLSSFLVGSLAPSRTIAFNSVTELKIALKTLFNLLEKPQALRSLLNIVKHYVATFLASSASATRPVDESIDIFHAQVYHHINVIDIEASRSHICSDEHHF